MVVALRFLSFVYRSRYAVASQIQRRFTSVLKSDRTARRHLAEMEAVGWLGVVPTRGVSPLWPKVFYVTPKGARRLRESLTAKGKRGDVIRVDRFRKEGFSAEHVVHEVLTTEFMLAVWQTVQVCDDVDLVRMERRSLATHSAFRIGFAGRTTRLIPDGMFVHRQEGRGLMCSFVELDTGSMSVKQLQAKFRRYDVWSTSAAGKEFLLEVYRRGGAKQPRPTYRLLFIANGGQTEDRGDRFQDVMAASLHYPLVQRRIWFTTSANLLHCQFNAAPLRFAIWRRCDAQDIEANGAAASAAIKALF